MAKRRKKQSTAPANDGGFGANPFAEALAGMERADAPPADCDPKMDAMIEEAEAAPALPGRAVVRKTRKGRGGKTVTVISHLGLGADVLDVWCKSLRKTLGCGGTVEGGEIVLQGDQTDRTVAELKKRGIKRVSG